MREDFLETDWLRAIRAVNEPSLRSETNQKDGIVGTVLLHARIRDARVFRVSGVVRKMAIPILLETSFIARFVKEVFLPEHKILLYNSAPIPIIATLIMTEEKQKQNKQEATLLKPL